MKEETFPLKKMLEDKDDPKFERLFVQTLGLFLDPKTQEDCSEKELINRVDSFLEQSLM